MTSLRPAFMIILGCNVGFGGLSSSWPRTAMWPVVNRVTQRVIAEVIGGRSVTLILLFGERDFDLALASPF